MNGVVKIIEKAGDMLVPGRFVYGVLLVVMLHMLAVTVCHGANDHGAGEDAPEEEVMQACLIDMLGTAPDDMTVGSMRKVCRKKLWEKKSAQASKTPGGSPVDRRLTVDEENLLRPFTIMAHRPNYLLLGAHNFQGYNAAEYIEASGDEDLRFDETEVQFQLSIKMPLAVNVFEKNVDIFAAYTAHSFWQLYNTANSSPFRETDHEPEVWLQAHPELELLGMQNEVAVIGVAHQSNGQSKNLSRSWNRIFADVIFHRGNLALSLKPWIRVGIDRDNDENPDIMDFMGHGQWRMVYTYADHTFSIMGRNNLESGFSRGAVELGWNFPLFDYPFLKGYVQYFSGYGESLVDYNRYVNKIGLGILLTDFM